VVGRCPPVPLVPRFTGGYCLPSLRDSSRGWSLTPGSARASLHRGLLSAVPPGLLAWLVPNPRFRSCLAAPGATVCRPSGTPLVVGRQPPVPLVPRFTGGYCLPSLRDSSHGWPLTPGSARASLHRGLLSAVPPGLLSWLVTAPRFRSCLASPGATVCRPSGTLTIGSGCLVLTDAQRGGSSLVPVFETFFLLTPTCLRWFMTALTHPTVSPQRRSRRL